jgi:hypothetical protein
MTELHSFAEAVTFLEQNEGATVHRYGSGFPRFISGKNGRISVWNNAYGPSYPIFSVSVSNTCLGYYPPRNEWKPEPVFSADDTRALDWVFVSKEDWETEKREAKESYDRMMEEAAKRWEEKANCVVTMCNSYPSSVSNTTALSLDEWMKEKPTKSFCDRVLEFFGFF